MLVRLGLGQPPTVVHAGMGLHGVTGLRDVFLLPDLWQLHLYDYDGELVVENVVHEIKPGRVSLIPPGVQVVYRYRGRSEHFYAHLRLSGEDPVTFPLMQEAGAQVPHLADSMRQAIVSLPRSAAQAAAEVWSVLWRVAGLSSGVDGHPATAKALAFIESRLAKSVTVPEIAGHAGVSHNHLIRLFQAELGETVVGYLRRRRLARAAHLLRESTMSIPAVAASVGIPDLQAFNKACRRELGASPRTLRAAGSGTVAQGVRQEVIHAGEHLSHDRRPPPARLS